jgi:RNA polymerase sigma-70 factor (ECF subfamily)
MEAASTAARPDLTLVMASAVAGDETAFGRIVAEHHDDMVRVCEYVAHSEAIADDAVQAAWAIAWRKLGTVRDPSRLRPWLIRVAVNEAKKELKRRGLRSGSVQPIDLSEPAGGLDPGANVSALDLRAALDRLGPDDRALLAMRYIAGFDATELSSALGISPAGTRTRLKRLLDRLRKDLADG